MKCLAGKVLMQEEFLHGRALLIQKVSRRKILSYPEFLFFSTDFFLLELFAPLRRAGSLT